MKLKAILIAFFSLFILTGNANASWNDTLNQQLNSHLSSYFTVVDFFGNTYYNQTYSQAQEILAETAVKASGFKDVAVYKNGNTWYFVAEDAYGNTIKSGDGDWIYGGSTNVYTALANLMDEVFEAGWDTGYQNGYKNGYLEGYIDGYADGKAGLASKF